MSRWSSAIWFVVAGSVCWLASSGAAIAQVKVEDVLAYRPSQKEVDIETPTADEIPKCKLEVERQGNGSGWVLYGPQGQLFRRFLDTNGDRNVDEFRYFKQGLEVYRDLDSNGNNEVDQSRWLNTAGTRWGLDKNEDRRIDAWQIISAEEASREAILAMVNRDEQRLLAVMITPEDVALLGVTGDAASRLTTNIKEAGQKFKTVLASSKIITPRTQWVRFDCSMLMPNLIPAEPGKSKNDLMVYENVMAIVDNGTETNGFVALGEMVPVGQAWKLTQVPQPLEGEHFEIADGGILLQPVVAGVTAAGEGVSSQLRELIDQLRALDAKAPQADSKPEEMTRYNVDRARLLAKLANEAATDEDKLMWLRQRLELIAAAAQMETFPNGIDELKRAETQLRQSKADENLLAFTVFQRLVAEYNLSMTKAALAERSKIQEEWLKSLEAFVNEFPRATDAADALLQLATTHELNGGVANAAKWYRKLTDDFPKSPAAVKAQGALRRLDLKGKPFRLAGKSLSGDKLDTAAYRGKVLAVIYWTTWCQPCTEDLPQIQELYKTYHQEGFEILGVNVDAPGAPVQEYIRNFKITWPHLAEEGGLDGRPAVEYGVISLPTMFLIDQSGVVVTPAATVEDFKKLVPELLKKKPIGAAQRP